MEYATLVEFYGKLEAQSKRLEKTRLIAQLLRQTKKDDLESIALLVEGKIFPNWDMSESGIAAKSIVKAIMRATGQKKETVEKEWKKTGDLGKATENLISKKSQQTLSRSELTVKKVLANLRKLATIEGTGSVDSKVNLIAELLTSAQPEEAKYVVKTVLSELRVGVGEGSVRDAVVWAFFGEELEIDLDGEEIDIPDRERYKEYVDSVQQAYDLSNDFGKVAVAAASKGLEGLKTIEMTVGKPVKAMLAIRAKDVEDGISRVGLPLEAEYKYDGFRVQVHKDSEGKVTLFTRRLEDVTQQFPEIVEYVRQSVKGREFILDTEAVGYNTKTKQYLPFQKMSMRIKRKYDIDRLRKELPVEVNVFDVLYHDGTNMLEKPFSERRKLVEKIVSNNPGKIVAAKHVVTKEQKDLENFYAESLEAGNEGLMLKKTDAPYKPGTRVGHMLKLKPTMDTLDLVIVRAEWGEGKRASWLSSYTVACQDAKGNLLEVGKVSTGLKEKDEEGLSFGQMTRMLKPLIKKDEGKEVEIKPRIVIEVDYEEIQQSPTYSSGYALRFPRVKGLREDKGVKDISTLKIVETYYGQQRGRV